jgi:hypothetical protein
LSYNIHIRYFLSLFMEDQTERLYQAYKQVIELQQDYLRATTIPSGKLNNAVHNKIYNDDFKKNIAKEMGQAILKLVTLSEQQPSISQEQKKYFKDLYKQYVKALSKQGFESICEIFNRDNNYINSIQERLKGYLPSKESLESDIKRLNQQLSNLETTHLIKFTEKKFNEIMNNSEVDDAQKKRFSEIKKNILGVFTYNYAYI